MSFLPLSLADIFIGTAYIGYGIGVSIQAWRSAPATTNTVAKIIGSFLMFLIWPIFMGYKTSV